MKNKLIPIFWGIVLIAAGVIFALDETGAINLNFISNGIWAAGFAVLSVFFFITYFLQGKHEWGWLFPACILGAIALIMFTEDTSLGRMLSGAPVLIAIAIPFFAVFLQEPKKNWWALIPAWVMAVISVIVLFEDALGGNLIGSLVLYSIALPFLVVFLWDRSKRWALIPFAVLAVVGLIPMLETLVDGDTLGMLIMFLFAIPFYVVYFWTRKQWWPIIPAGVFTSIGLVVLLEKVQLIGTSSGYDPLGSAVMLAGIGLTFGVLWLLRTAHHTDWAKYPALVLLALAVVALAGGKNLETYWPVALIAAGVLTLVLGLIKKPTALDK